MQKISIAIVLALTLSCAIAASYTVTDAGWVKKPVTICNDTESCNNFQNYNLVSLTSSDVNFAAYNGTTGDVVNSTSWSVFTKTIITKDLASTVNKTYGYKAHQLSYIQYGYAIAFVADNGTGIPQLYPYQTQLSTPTELPRVQVSNNTNKDFLPVAVGEAITTKSIFVFFTTADKNVNATSYPIGTATQGKMIAITSALMAGGFLGAATGEALSSSQAYIAWQEVDTGVKVGVVDFSAGTLTNTGDLVSFNKGYACSPYATDKKYYGVICKYTPAPVLPAAPNATIFVSANSTTLYQLLFIANTTAQMVDATPIAYGPYIALFTINPTNPAATVLSYDIWDLEKYNTTKTQTAYLTVDITTTGMAQYRVPQGGLYALTFNKPSGTILTATNIQVGQLMGASYLTSVFGSLLAIIAGLFLF
jgi:hypothetical protein